MRWNSTLVAAAALASAGLVAASCAAPPVARIGEVLPFVRDDYARALGEARARKLPIFVESWAPW